MDNETAGGDPSGFRATLSGGSLAGHWVLDPPRSTVTLRSKSLWGLVPVKGSFHRIEGDGEVAADGTVAGRISLATSSFDSKNKKRDADLRSDDFFATERFPAISFELVGLSPSSSGAAVSGTLTVRDLTKPIAFPVAVVFAGPGEVVVEAAFDVDRSEFGLTWNQLGMVSMKNAITVHAVFTKT